MSDILNTSADFMMRYLIVGSIMAAVLIPLILLIIKATRIRTPVYKHTIWLYCLIGIVLLPGLWLYAPKLSIAVLPAEVQIEDTIVSPEQLSSIERFDIQEFYVKETPDVDHTPAVQSTNIAATNHPFLWRSILTGVWLIGFAFMLSRLIIGWYRLRVICNTATVTPQSESLLKTNGQEVPVLLTSKLEGPACFGVFKPLVLLPINMYNSTPINDINIVLAHELAHIERGDCWVNLFQRIVEACFFFHPFIWIASRQLTQQREHICDNYVLAKGVSPEDYTTLLSNIGKQALKQISLPTVALFEGQLLSRVRNLFDPLRSSKTRLSIKATIVCTIIVSLVFVIIGCVRLTEKPVSQIKPATTLTLPEAAEAGDFAEVKRLINEGANVNAKDKNDITALQWATIIGNKDIAELMIANGADPNVRGGNGNTLLHQAARRGWNSIIELLIANGANLNAENKQGRTPLDIAKLGNKGKTVKLLLKHGARGDTTIVLGIGATLLHQAAAEGKMEQAKSLIATGTDINAKDAKDRTPLHYAAKYGSKDIAELLLSKGANVNAMAQDETPLHNAARQGYIELVELLIANGAGVNARYKNSRTPLYFAAENGHIDVVKLLIAEGADVNIKADSDSTPLHRALMSTNENKKEIVELLISKGADINARLRSGGRTPIYTASQRGWKEIVEFLIDKGADVDPQVLRIAVQKNDSELVEFLLTKGVTAPPLHLSAFRGDLDKVRSYLEQGKAIDEKDTFGCTPLYWALWAEQTEVAKFLIDKGANVFTKGEFDNTILQLAVRKGNRQLIDLLISKGADVNESSGRGTALHWAADPDIARLLISKGAEVNIKGWRGRTPLFYHGNDVVEVLITRGADVNTKDEWGQTPLWIAVRNGNKKTVEFLIEKGANIHTPDNKGRTPLAMAEERGHTKIVELLKKHGAKESPSNNTETNQAPKLRQAVEDGNIGQI